MRRKTTAILALALMLTLVSSALAGCTTFDNFKEAFFSKNGAEADTVRIGVLEPQTGNDSGKGEWEMRGIELAHELYPKVLEKDVELVYADTQSSIYVAESAVGDLIDKKPAVVLGSYGDAVSLVASRQLGEARIPAIAMTVTNPLITANNDYYFRVSFTDADQGSALAEFTYTCLGQVKAAVIQQKGEDSVSELVRRYTSRMKELTKDANAIEADIQIDKNVKDYSDCIEKVKQSGVRVVFMPLPLSAAEKVFDTASKAFLVNIVFIGPKDWNGEDLLKLQEKYPAIKIATASDALAVASGQAVQEKDANKDGQNDQTESSKTSAEDMQSDLYKEFFTAYQKKYGKEEPPEAVALGFDAYMIALRAIEEAGSVDGYAVKEAMKNTEGYAGVSGDISFGPTGEPKKTIHVNMIQNGVFVTVFTFG